MGKGWVLPQDMLKLGCYFWHVPGPRAVVQAAAGRWLGVALPNVHDGQGLLCGDFFQVWAWHRGMAQGRESSRLYLSELGEFRSLLRAGKHNVQEELGLSAEQDFPESLISFLVLEPSVRNPSACCRLCSWSRGEGGT